MYIENSIYILLRRVRPERAMQSWLEQFQGRAVDALYQKPDVDHFTGVWQDNFDHCSVDEAGNAFRAIMDLMKSDPLLSESGIFGALAFSVQDIFDVDVRRECICKFRSLMKFRTLSHSVDQLVFVSAFLARYDLTHFYQRNVFSFPPIVRSDNIRLHHLLDDGMAENHFHIGGSVSAFLYSWICLMNHLDANRREEFKKSSMDRAPLDQRSSVISDMGETFYSLTFKAACIRYFLFLRLHGEWPISRHKTQTSFMKERGENSFFQRAPSGDDVEIERQQAVRSEHWLAEILQFSETECDLHLRDMDARFAALRTCYCGETATDFVPDYAMAGEPCAPMDDRDVYSSSDHAVRNFERRLYRSISGEQRFQYQVFRAIYSKDPRILPYADLMYAYLLIYCKLRGELIQTNLRVGFGNFLIYQNRKETFTSNWGKYERMRSCVAQQSVILNPQIRYFEGRMIPSKSAAALIEKINLNYGNALCAEGCNDDQREHIRKCAEEKLHYVLHFAKKKQEIKREDPMFEALHPRDSELRKTVARQAEAIIGARALSVSRMSLVTGIDACANEIGCRPEVFACAFRRIRQSKEPQSHYFENDIPLPSLRITYHAGEDFLDVSDGMRAIDESVRFLEMKRGDRLGHALALGVDVEEWYAFKKYTVILPKQDFLDNIAWVYGKMREYGVYNRAAEDYICENFRKLFNELYFEHLEKEDPVCHATVEDYCYAQSLRGNDPYLYFSSPLIDKHVFLHQFQYETAFAPWRATTASEKVSDIKSLLLYHYYHFHSDIKIAACSQSEWQIPRAFILAVADVQKRMQQEIADRELAIECNPSSNYLIGTFRDYCKHPIFSFNDTHLFDSPQNPKISVSINTDDLGIFDTSLENEYALLACALEERNQSLDPQKRIPPENIYRWLDHVRKMGCEQSFKHHEGF